MCFFYFQVEFHLLIAENCSSYETQPALLGIYLAGVEHYWERGKLYLNYLNMKSQVLYFLSAILHLIFLKRKFNLMAKEMANAFSKK